MAEEATRIRSWPRPTAGQAGAGLAVAALGVAWPLASEVLASGLGVRPLALTLLAASAVSWGTARRAAPPEYAPRALELVALFTATATAAISGDRFWLLLLPALIHFALGRLLLRSLDGGGSLFERVAFRLQPHAPDFIRPYCRRSTQLWAWLFFANAGAITLLAAHASVAQWRAFSSLGVWLVLALLAAVDFAVRKLYFRIYDDGPLDRWLASAFPAERTAMGRRSNAYRAAKRSELGYPAPRRNS